MKFGYLGLLTALLCLGGVALAAWARDPAVAVVWLCIGLFWLVTGLVLLRAKTSEADPVRRLVRRLSRILLFFG